MFTQAIVGNINYMITPNQMLFMSSVNNLEFMLNSYRRVTPKPTLGIPAPLSQSFDTTIFGPRCDILGRPNPGYDRIACMVDLCKRARFSNL